MRDDIGHQPQVLSVADLRTMQRQKRDDCLTNGSHYHLASGLLVQPTVEKTDSDDQQLRKILGKRTQDKNKLVKAVAEQEVVASKIPLLKQARIADDCNLVDEKQATRVLLINPKGAAVQPELISGLDQKRKLKSKLVGRGGLLFDQVKYFALEGSSLTLLGIIKYEK